MRIQSQSNTNFQAYKIARVSTELKGRGVSDIDICLLTREDRNFLNKLEKKIDYRTLFPKLSLALQRRWQKVLAYCIACAHDPDNRTYVALHDGKPCGIMTYTEDSSFYLEGLCAIPQEKNKKVPFTGDTLLYQLFKDAFAAGASDIKLKAVTDGPFDVVKKYESRGFKKNPASQTYTEMRCNKHKIKEQLEEYPYTLDYTELEPEKINLDDTLD